MNILKRTVTLCSGALILLLFAACASGRPATLQSPSGITLQVDPEQGTYAVRYNSQSWLGSGFVSVLVGNRWYRSASVVFPEAAVYNRNDGRLSLINVKQGVATDRLGAYDFLDLSWEVPSKGIHLVTGFHLYRTKPYLVFTQDFPDGFKGYENGKWTMPSVAFPDFLPQIDQARKDLYSWIYGGLDVQRFAYGPATSVGGNVDILLLADRNLDSIILSPFANYLVATQQSTPVATRDESLTTKGEIACGIEGLVQQIPSGFHHETIMVAGEGITGTLRQWGSALLDKSGKQTPSKYSGDNLKYLTYWDDYGAYYNTHRFKEDGYKTYEDIILGVAKDARDHGLRIGAYEVQDSDQMLFDHGLFEPRPDLFPHGLKWLHEQLGAPLEAYTSWITGGGPYRAKYPYYETPPGELFGFPSGSMGDVFYSKQYWTDTAKKLADWGDIVLQQDYLSTYDGDPVMMGDVNRMENYLRNETEALEKHGISMEYCMTFARNILQSTENPIVVSLQSSADHHVYMAEPKPEHRDDDPYMWKQMIFASALYGAVGLWPSRDNIQTVADPNAWEDLLMANLMGGEIQLGHRIGEADFALLRKTYRDGDEVILKPDQPIEPLDRCYLEECAVGWTKSTIDGRSWYYILSLPQSGALDHITAKDLHLEGDWLAYDYETHTTYQMAANTPIDLRTKSKHQYFVFAPLLPTGMAVLGDTSKFVTMSEMRIASVKPSEDGVEVGIISRSGYNPIITGYSERQPVDVTVRGKSLLELSSLSRLQLVRSGWFRDPQTNLWYVKPDFTDTAEMTTVVFAVKSQTVSR
jgi:hypothetical protein